MACATRGDVKRIEDQLVLSRAESARQDSVRAARLSEIIQLQRRILDSLAASDRALRAAVQTSLQSFRGDVSGDLYNIQQQLVQIQALTGQSQQRLTELRTQLEARSEQLNAAARQPVPAADTSKPAGPPPSASADQMYETSLQQLRRGSVGTARLGFRELLRLYPNDPRVADATYFVGETFSAEAPDSAAQYYGTVVQSFPTSARAATSLYKLGLLAERRKDLDAAKTYYQRVVKEYPKSDEAALARDRLKSLGR
jgi:tol-pal system protein YbgF